MPTPNRDPASSLPTEQWQARQELLERFEVAWLTGPRPDIEEYLFKDSSDRRAQLPINPT
jgi:hypothetical protein